MDWIRLAEAPVPVKPHANIIFSNAPHKALAEDGQWYYIKGPDRDLVVAEALGYELAGLAGLLVPPARFCRVPGVDGIHFASCARRVRSVDTLIGTPHVANPEFLPLCILFDVWIANRDRNVNNLVGEPNGGADGSTLELHAIDFEKAEVLRGVSQIELAMRDAKFWWPKGELGQLVRDVRFPLEQCGRIESITRAQIDGVFERLALSMDFWRVPWEVSGCHQLASRAERIEQLAREAWNG